MSISNIGEITDNFNRGQRFVLVLLLVAAVFIGLFVPHLLSLNTLSRIVLSREYEAGELADEDVICPEDYSFFDEVATAEAKKIASSSVIPIFSCSLQDTSYNNALVEEFVHSFAKGSTFYTDFSKKYRTISFDSLYSEYQTLEEGDRAAALILVRDYVRYIMDIGIFNEYDIEKLRDEGYQYVVVEYYRNGKIEKSLNAVLLDELVSHKYLYSSFLDWLSKYEIKYNANFIKFVFNSIDTIVKPNYYYDEAYTNLERKRIENEVVDVNIEIDKGEYIIKADTIVTEQQLRIINRINSINVNYSYSELLGRALLLFTVTVLCILFFIYNTDRRYRIVTFSLTLMVSFVFTLLLSFLLLFLTRTYKLESVQHQAMPFLLMPLLITHLTNKRKLGIISGVLYSFYMIFIIDNNIVIFCYLVSMIVIGILFVRFGVNRIDMIFQSFYTALSCSVLTMIFHLMNQNPLNMLLSEILTVFLNVTITYVLISISLPIIEHITNIPTVFRLHELCTTDAPILQRMRVAAPGTYNHVNNVADMAYEAIKEIGGNAELAKVGGLYHDIGKIEHPEYFVE
nr:HDIG domain-containing protein [Sphaerochaetaceae bacterium]